MKNENTFSLDALDDYLRHKAQDETNTQIDIQNVHNSLLSKKILIGGFALFLSISPIHFNSFSMPKPTSLKIDEIAEFDNKSDEFYSITNDIKEVKNYVSNKYDIYDEDDLLEEQLLTEYIETVKDLYKDQFKPFNL